MTEYVTYYIMQIKDRKTLEYFLNPYEKKT